jgi:hypothetical protein
MNVASTSAPAAVDELIPVGPLRVQVRLPLGIGIRRMKFLVSGQKPSLTIDKGAALFQLPSLLDHEVIVLE